MKKHILTTIDIAAITTMAFDQDDTQTYSVKAQMKNRREPLLLTN